MPAGVAYGYFGAITQSALAKMQAAEGISPASGYFGPITKAKVNSMMVVTTTPGTPTPGTPAPGTLQGGAGDITVTERSSGVEDEILEGEEEVKVLGIPKKNFQGVDATGDSLILTPNMNKSGYSEYRTLAKDKLTEEGYHLVELVEPYMINDKKVKYALIKNEGSAGKTSINRLPDEVLHRIPGYVPRNYKPGYYFVKDIS